MRFIDKLLFLLLALSFTALGVLMIYSVLNAQMVLNLLEDMLLRNQWMVVISGAVVAFIGIFLVLNMLFTKKEKIAKVSGSEIGQVTMSVGAIESMINSTVANIGGVKEVTPKLKIVGDKVAICLHMVVSSDASVPELGTAVQKAVKEDLENLAGITVAEVKVLISSVDGAGSGKESKKLLSGFKKAEKKEDTVEAEPVEATVITDSSDRAAETPGEKSETNL